MLAYCGVRWIPDDRVHDIGNRFSGYRVTSVVRSNEKYLSPPAQATYTTAGAGSIADHWASDQPWRPSAKRADCVRCVLGLDFGSEWRGALPYELSFLPGR